jgi:hypothetical protein
MIELLHILKWVCILLISIAVLRQVLMMIVTLTVLHGMLSNPERYLYIQKLSEMKNMNGQDFYSEEQLIEMQISKASRIAKRFLNWIHW